MDAFRKTAEEEIEVCGIGSERRSLVKTSLLELSRPRSGKARHS